MAIRTIFDTAEDCSHGARQGWFEFVRDYAPTARTLLSQYFPSLAPDLDAQVTSVFARAHADRDKWFRELRFQNEREFAMAFRDLVFVHGSSAERLPAPPVGPEDVVRSLEGLSLVQREFFWGFLRGWNVEQISAMLMNASATAEDARKFANERLAALVGTADRVAVARVAMQLAQAASTADCLSWKICNNLVNGQISWAERDRAEKHMSGCLHCLDAFTAFQEMIWLRKQAQPLSAAETKRLLAGLHLTPESKGLLGRLFSRAS